MNIVFIGFPGSGKTTQANILAKKLGMAHFSHEDIFWGEIARKTALGIEVYDDLSAGRLVPDWLTMGLLKDRLV